MASGIKKAPALSVYSVVIITITAYVPASGQSIKNTFYGDTGHIKSTYKQAVAHLVICSYELFHQGKDID